MQNNTLVGTTLAAAGVLALGLAVPDLAQAQTDLPCSAVRMIVPANAGGATDTLARIMADAAGRLGATPPLQVVNVGGQATLKGTIEASKAKPDGCTILITHESLLQAPLVSGAPISYESFEPVAQVTSNPAIIAAGSAAPYTKIEELVAAAKDKPDAVLAGASLGGASHFGLLAFQDAAGVKFKYVSYNGAQDALTALLGNHVEIINVQPADVQEGVKTGNAKALVVLSSQRIPAMPDVPTAAEVGYNVAADLTHGIFLPKNASSDIIEHYRAMFETITKDEKFVSQIAAVGSLPAYLPADQFKQRLAEKKELYSGIAERMSMLAN
jgi:tripartite-type tricarboxylate transporter receptor subunit TctC